MVHTLIVGLGNPVLGDDGVGWKIADLVEELIPGQYGGETQIEVERLSLGGLSLMERLVGYDRAILIDALEIGKGPPGSVYNFTLDELPNPSAGHSGSAHDTTLQSALEIGRALGAHLPDQVIVIAVEAKTVYEFSDKLTPQISKAVPIAAQKVCDIILNSD